MAKFTQEDDALLEELGVEVETEVAGGRSPLEERIIAGFEDIQKFVDKNGRPPQHGDDRDIFERIYAVRLDQLRRQPDCVAILTPLDRQGLLAGKAAAAVPDDLDDDALLAELGVDVVGADDEAITTLRHVRSSAEKKAAEEIANRQKCEDFSTFKPLFDKVQQELDSGIRETRPFERKAEIEKGRFYILAGQKAYVADMEEPFTNDQGKRDARLRVIYDNGTESNLLMRSLQKALSQDENGRRIIEPHAGPLFSGEAEEGDERSGIVYVLRSKSDNPLVAANRTVVHKIGVTGGSVERRIANAKLDPTFLLADVEVVATYRLYNINRSKLENVIHRVFGPGKLDISIKDRFGNPVVPREWFLVPLQAIDEAIERIKDGTIGEYQYEPGSAALVKGTSRHTAS